MSLVEITRNELIGEVVLNRGDKLNAFNVGAEGRTLSVGADLASASASPEPA